MCVVKPRLDCGRIWNASAPTKAIKEPKHAVGHTEMSKGSEALTEMAGFWPSAPPRNKKVTSKPTTSHSIPQDTTNCSPAHPAKAPSCPIPMQSNGFNCEKGVVGYH